MMTYVIGRSAFADIVVADDSVAPRHAELLITDDGRFHVTDCATGTGTWRQSSSSLADGTISDPAWEPVRQAFVAKDEQLRLGGYLCTPRALLRAVSADRKGTEGAGPWPGAGAPDRPQRPRGRVERDAKTGEIVRTRYFGDV